MCCNDNVSVLPFLKSSMFNLLLKPRMTLVWFDDLRKKRLGLVSYKTNNDISTMKKYVDYRHVDVTNMYFKKKSQRHFASK